MILAQPAVLRIEGAKPCLPGHLSRLLPIELAVYRDLSRSSKFNNYPPFLEYLFDLGRETGHAWITEHRAALGQRSTINLQQLLPEGAYG